MGTSKWLDKEVTVLPGVGANRRQLLAKLGLYTLRDVLYGFPRTYQDFTEYGRQTSSVRKGNTWLQESWLSLQNGPFRGPPPCASQPAHGRELPQADVVPRSPRGEGYLHLQSP